MKTKTDFKDMYTEEYARVFKCIDSYLKKLKRKDSKAFWGIIRTKTETFFIGFKKYFEHLEINQDNTAYKNLSQRDKDLLLSLQKKESWGKIKNESDTLNNVFSKRIKGMAIDIAPFKKFFV